MWVFVFRSNLMSDKRLKALETEVAYLSQKIEKLIEQIPVEIHYHYAHDYGKMKKIIDYFKQESE